MTSEQVSMAAVWSCVCLAINYHVLSTEFNLISQKFLFSSSPNMIFFKNQFFCVNEIDIA